MHRLGAAAWLFMCAAGCSAALAAPGDPTADDPYRRLGDPARIVEIREMEIMPFDFALLDGLSSWSGEALTRESLGDRLLVLLAWDQGDAKSVRLLPTLSRLERTMGQKAAFLAVHARGNWEDARHAIEAGRVPVTSAHDAEGTLFEALKADDHPNLYIVDRAGNIRCADLDPRDLNRALIELSRETPEAAKADQPRRIERLASVRALMPQTAPAGPGNGPAALPGTPERRDAGGGADGVAPVLRAVPRPDPAVYARAPWPAINTQGINARNIQGQRLPDTFGQETWITERPDRPVHDHVLVFDFWATWCGPCLRASPTLDAVQQRYPDEVLVMGVSGQAAGSRYPEDERSIRAFVEQHPVSYSHLHDAQQRLYRSLAVTAIPHVMVVSTDGVVRWQGNPLDPNFRRVVDEVVRADPYLAAQRDAMNDAGGRRP
jgi:cytochrome c biogenesis protein CcmG/thiol:disulfide interchange protein DsbE